MQGNVCSLFCLESNLLASKGEPKEKRIHVQMIQKSPPHTLHAFSLFWTHTDNPVFSRALPLQGAIHGLML